MDPSDPEHTPNSPATSPSQAAGLTADQLRDTEIAFKHLSDNELLALRRTFRLMALPILADLGPKLLEWAYKLRLPISGLVKPLVYDNFCGGETFEECRRRLVGLADHGVKAILIYGVEGKKNEAEFARATAWTIKTIEFASRHPDLVAYCVFKPTGIADIELLAAVDRGDALTGAQQQDYAAYLERVDAICAAAAGNKVNLFFDAEETWIQNGIDELCLKMSAQYNPLGQPPVIYNTYQCYRKDAVARLTRDIARARSEGFTFAAKVVRGAYLDMENERAELLGYPSPIHATKDDTDAAYNEALKILVENIDQAHTSACTHNSRSTALLTQLMAEHGISPSDPRIDFGQLLGMSDNLTYNLAHGGYQVCKYVPFGPVKEVIPYLMRRAQENAAVGGETGRELARIRQECQRRGL